MPVFVALLRAVNVGGTGKLPMVELRRMCEAAGFTHVETYIASGNVVFRSPRTAAEVRALLQASLSNYLNKPTNVILRTAAELAAVLKANPFAQAPGNFAHIHFLDAPPARSATGMGHSKLVIPAAASGTARNLNTVSRLVEMARSK
jgi:uncharacterized protein (DUF1697 family)